MLVTTKYLFQHCYGKYAIPAVNVSFMEQTLGLFAAAEKANAPFIVQTTPASRNYAKPEMLVAIIKAAARIYPKTIFALHLDHGDEEHIWHALDSGDYTSVMIDASHDDFATNIKRTKAVVARAHQQGVSVEAELGVLAGVEDDLSIDEAHALYTNPNEVETFVKETSCDSLAIAVGTSHGAYKFSGGQGLQFAVLEEIQQRLPGFPLVLHGGSAVNHEEIRRINAAGGKLQASAKGVDPEEVKKAIAYGICKVNLATDFRLLWTRVNREYFQEHPDDFAPMNPGKIYMEAYVETMLQKFDLLNATGKANTIKR